MTDVAFWFVFAVVLLGMVATVLMIGRPRTPITPGQALFALLFNGLVLWAVVYLWQT